LIIKFSQPLDTSSFRANKIIKDFEMERYDENRQFIDKLKFSFDILFIRGSKTFQFNGKPLDFLYNTKTNTCAFVFERNMDFPNGSDEGFHLEQSGSFVADKSLRSENGKSLDENFYLNIKVEGNNQFGVVPNPYVVTEIENESLPGNVTGRGERVIYFINLPSNCVIKIKNNLGILVRTIFRNDELEGGDQKWNLRDENRNPVPYGIYQYEIYSDRNVFQKGALVIGGSKAN